MTGAEVYRQNPEPETRNCKQPCLLGNSGLRISVGAKAHYVCGQSFSCRSESLRFTGTCHYAAVRPLCDSEMSRGP